MLKDNEDATGATGAGKHEGRAAVQHSKRPEPELNQEDAPADSTQAGSNHQGQAPGGAGGQHSPETSSTQTETWYRNPSAEGMANTPRGVFQGQ